jgi:uncharacterized repeat protein (TIGR01451 family)
MTRPDGFEQGSSTVLYEEETLSTLRVRGIRSIAIVFALLLALGLTGRAALAVAPSINVTPNSGPVTAPISVAGANFVAGQQVSIYFGSTYEVTVTASPSGMFNASFNVPSVSTGVATIYAFSPGGNAQTSFTVTSSPATLSVLKYVTVNGLGYGLTGVASPGDQLTYRVAVTNQSGTTMSNVTVTDVLQGGQIAFTSPAFCTYSGSTSTVTCTDPTTLAAGATFNVYFTTVVDTGFYGNIVNTAQATASGFTAVSSNSTEVNVNAPFPTQAQLQLCGPVTAYTPAAGSPSTIGSITISGVRLAVAPYAQLNGSPIVLGSNMCFAITTDGYQTIAAATITPNLAGVDFICGVYAPNATPGSVTVDNIVVPVASGGVINPLVVNGAYYCFTLNLAGQITGVLSGIPTSVVFTQGRRADLHGAPRAL